MLMELDCRLILKGTYKGAFLRVHKVDLFFRLHIVRNADLFLKAQTVYLLDLLLRVHGYYIFLDSTRGPNNLDFTCMGPTQKIHCKNPGFWIQRVAPNKGLLGCRQGQRMTSKKSCFTTETRLIAWGLGEGFLNLNSRLY